MLSLERGHYKNETFRHYRAYGGAPECKAKQESALRATFFQKKALSGVASRRILFYALNAGGLAHVRCSATSIQTAEILKRVQDDGYGVVRSSENFSFR